jgi:hypothetical protein
MSVQFGRFPSIGRLSALVAAVAISAASSQQAAAVDPVLVTTPSFYLNEVFFNTPPSGSADDDEYFEVRGTASTAFSNLWLVALENEDTASVNPGTVDFAYQLTGSTNASGFAWFGNTGHDYSTSAPNTSPNATFANDSFEGSGGTYLLVSTADDTSTSPTAGHTWDSNVDGTFDTNFDSDWDILDAVGVFAEEDDVSGLSDPGRLYAYVNFAADDGANIDRPSGGVVVDTSRSALNGNANGANPDNAFHFNEIEYVGRYGDSTGRVAASIDDWTAMNLTDNAASGFAVPPNNYGVSGRHASLDRPESVRGDNVISPFGYGHDVTVGLGASNSVSYTPEPASFAMAAMGGIAMLGMVRRRRD